MGRLRLDKVRKLSRKGRKKAESVSRAGGVGKEEQAARMCVIPAALGVSGPRETGDCPDDWAETGRVKIVACVFLKKWAAVGQQTEASLSLFRYHKSLRSPVFVGYGRR